MKPTDVTFVVVCSLFFCIYLSVDRYLSVFFFGYGHSALDIGLLLAIKNCFTFIFSFCFSQISVYYDIKLQLILSALIYNTISIQLFNIDWIINNYINTLIVFTFFSICYRSYVPLVNVYTIQVCLENDSSKYGNFRIFGAIGSALGTIIYGIFIYIYNFYNILPITFGISNLLSFLLTIFLYYYTKPKQELMQIVDTASRNELAQLNTTIVSADENINDLADESTNVQGKLSLSNEEAINITSRHTYDEDEDDEGDEDEQVFIINYLRDLNWFEFSELTIMSLNVFIYGIFMSIIDSYSYIYFIEEYNASYLFISIAIITMIVGELPIFQFSKKIIQIFGNNVLLITAQIAFIIRMIFYTEILPHKSKYVWYILIIQPLHGLCYAGMWIATVNMAHKIAKNKHFQVTVQAFMDGILEGICKAFGALIGGVIYKYYGGTKLLQICAISMFVWFIIFLSLLLVLHKCNIKLMFRR